MSMILKLLNRTDAGKRNDLKINRLKTNYITISRSPSQKSTTHIKEQLIERVQTFKYLGTTINKQWKHQQEIQCRIEQTRQVIIKIFLLQLQSFPQTTIQNGNLHAQDCVYKQTGDIQNVSFKKNAPNIVSGLGS